MKNPPAFQFYPRDFLADLNVQLMDMTARGVYITLLCLCWENDGLPTDESVLARLCGVPRRKFAAVWNQVVSCFEKVTTEDGRASYFNRRMLRALSERKDNGFAAVTMSTHERAKRAATIRWDKSKQGAEIANADANSMGEAMLLDANSNATLMPHTRARAADAHAVEVEDAVNPEEGSGEKPGIIRDAERLARSFAAVRSDRLGVRATPDEMPDIIEQFERLLAMADVEDVELVLSYLDSPAGKQQWGYLHRIMQHGKTHPMVTTFGKMLRLAQEASGGSGSGASGYGYVEIPTVTPEELAEMEKIENGTE